MIKQYFSDLSEGPLDWEVSEDNPEERVPARTGERLQLDSLSNVLVCMVKR